MFSRNLLYFLGGVVLGAVATRVITKGDVDVRELGANLLGKGITLGEDLLSKANVAKENIDDFVAEARQSAAPTTKKTSAKKA